MEIRQISLLLICTFLLFIFMTVKNEKFSKQKHPPGPKKLPFIGNLHQLIGALPHRSLKDLSEKYGPVMHLQLCEVSAVIISSPEAAKEVMKSRDLSFADRPQIITTKFRSEKFTNLAFAPYGEYWRQLRKISTLELLSVRRVQSYRSIREEEVANLVNSVSSSRGAHVNLSKMMEAFTNIVICKAAFGKKNNEEDEFLLATQELIKASGGFDLPDIFPSYKLLHQISGRTGSRV